MRRVTIIRTCDIMRACDAIRINNNSVAERSDNKVERVVNIINSIDYNEIIY